MGDASQPPPNESPSVKPPARLVVLAGAFFVPTMGYAATVTSIPAIQRRVGIDESGIAILLLVTLLCAAVGSVLADRVAVRWGSRQAVMLGLVLQAAALSVNATTTQLWALVVGLCLFGIGLGLTDASASMQGALAQRHRGGAPVFGRLYAAGTTGAILGSLLTAGALALELHASAAMLFAAVLASVLAVIGWFGFDPTRAAHPPRERAGMRASPRERVAARARLPMRGIFTVGAVVFAAFVVDSSVASWSAVYLTDDLGAADAVTPLGYAAYLGVALATRVVADPLVRRFGRSRVAGFAAVLGSVGLLAVAVVHDVPGAIIGFAAAGAAFGLLVPVAFSRAGELVPERSDEVIARVNLFNYAAGLVGAVIPGLVGPLISMGPTFLIGVVALVAVAPLLRGLRARGPISGPVSAPDSVPDSTAT